ncbi:PAS domain S-box protein [Candidatus Latescibacterota bacterium]
MQIVILGFVLVVLVGAADYLTGTEISFSIFYLIPIALVSWYRGRKTGIAFAVLCAFLWFMLEKAGGKIYSNFFFAFWNAVVRGGIFFITAWLVSRQRYFAEAERLLAAETLVKSEERFRTALENMLEGCQIIGFDWRYLYINDSAARYGHQAKEELLGRTMMEVYPGIETTEMFAALRRCMEKRIAQHMENEFSYPDGTSGWFELSIQPVPEGIFILSLDISERKRAEKELERSEGTLRAIFESARDGILVIDVETRKFVVANETICQMLGYSHDEIMSLGFEDIHPMEDLPRVKNLVEQQIKDEISLSPNIPVKRKDGTVFYTDVNATPVEIGGISCLFGLFRDITERKRIEDALRTNEELYRTLVETTPGLVCRFQPDGTITFANETYCRYFGKTREEIIGSNLFRLIPPEYHDFVKNQYLSLTRENPSVTYEHEVFLPDGSRSFQQWTDHLLFDERGNPLEYQSLGFDINERKNMEERQEHLMRILETLNQSTEKRDTFKRLLALIKELAGIKAVAIRIRDGEDYPLYETNGFSDDFIQHGESLLERDADGTIHYDEDERPLFDCMCGAVIRGITDTSSPCFTTKGSFWTSNFSSLYRDDNAPCRAWLTRDVCFREGFESVALIPLRSVSGIIGILMLMDRRKGLVTEEMVQLYERVSSSIGIALERELAGEQLKEYSQNLEEMVAERTKELNRSLHDTEEARDRIDVTLKAVREGIIVTDISRRIVGMNHAAEDLLGVRLSDVINRPVDSMIDDEDFLSYVHITIQQDISTRFGFALERADDSAIYLQANTTVIHDRNGKKTGIVVSFHDITEEREIDRMKTEFISTAAHELRSPLTSILGFSELLKERKDISKTEQKKMISYIHKQSTNLSKIVSDLLDISRIESGYGLELNKEITDIGNVIEEVVAGYRGIGTKHEFVVSLPEGERELLVDPEKIEQVMKNIVDNAVKYSPGGGKVTITGEVDENYFHVTVSDEGIGMALTEVERIFDKFYRADISDGAIEGTGLGMNIVKYLVEGHGGEVMVESEKGKGTRVTARLPK